MSNLSLDNLLCHAKETFTHIYMLTNGNKISYPNPSSELTAKLNTNLDVKICVYTTTKALEILHCSYKNRYLADAD
ncbi:hypothetical protein DPMN_150529 [Dreissena polymorpha]|uniref:Uncharacterized protein n=1 Tax=Dreissena polymorpha TaxID=45954 RepID=A0A9D4J628_DREPO|nr:hypothetical protein DPMN_150529 [Dreissena polymorpha]